MVEITRSQLDALADQMPYGTCVLVQGDNGGDVVVHTNVNEGEDAVFILGESGHLSEPSFSDRMEVEAAAKERGLDPIENLQDSFLKAMTKARET